MIYKSTCTIIDLLQAYSYFRSNFRSFFFLSWNNSILVPTNLTTHDLTSIIVSMHTSTMTFSKNWPKTQNTFSPIDNNLHKTRNTKHIHMKPWWILYTQVRNNIWTVTKSICMVVAHIQSCTKTNWKTVVFGPFNRVLLSIQTVIVQWCD